MSAAEIIVGGWQTALALVGAGVALAQRRALKRGNVALRESVPAWQASGSQCCEFLAIALFCLLGVGLICSAGAKMLFPGLITAESGVLFLVPATQTFALAALLLAVKLCPNAFPEKFDADSSDLRLREAAKSWLSPKDCFGIPALFAVGFAATFVLSLLTAALIPFLPETLRDIFQENQILVNAIEKSENPALFALCVPAIAVFTPIIEEIIFRAGLYRFLKSKMRTVPAAVVSSAIFALMHDAPASYLPLTVLGCIFCFAYEKTGQLAAPVCIHALFNANTLLCLSLL